MANNPVVYTIPDFTWVKVADNVTQGRVVILDPRPGYKATYRVNPSTPPNLNVDVDNSPKLQKLNQDIESDIGIDVYYMTIRRTGDGKVTVYT